MTALPPPTALIRPAVTEADAANDRSWFLSNSQRRYRARHDDAGNVWIIRRKSKMALLRTYTGAREQLPLDRDDVIRAAWVASAWPQLTALERTELVGEIRTGEPRR